jgi:hypothetical protein
MMSRSKSEYSSDIRQLVVGTVFKSSEAFRKLCEDQTSYYKFLSAGDVKDIACCRFPGKKIWGAVEAMIPEDPHRYLFWLEHLEGQLRVAGVERLTSASQVSK